MTAGAPTFRQRREVTKRPPVKTTPPTLYLFAGSNGAGKTTFARAYLRQLDPIPRFLNADEIARGLSPLDPQKLAIKAGKLLLHEIQDCLPKQQHPACRLAFRLRKLHSSGSQTVPPAMKSPKNPQSPLTATEQPAFIARGQAAAKAMAKELRAEHKRWNLPLLSWKDGKVVATKL